MHQTFYLDIDEEITSVVDRLRKSKTKENIFVIPKRALVLQSAVNLKILKKEAEKLKRQIMIITQDEQGRALTDKVGILSQYSLEGIEETEELKVEIHPKIKSSKKKNKKVVTEKKKKMENVGSDSYYDENAENDSSKENIDIAVGASQEREKSKRRKVRETVSDIINLSSVPFISSKNKSEAKSKKAETKEENQPLYDGDLDPGKEKELNEFFHLKENDQEGAGKHVSLPGKTKKVVLSFVIISAFLIILVAIFLVLPKAKVNVFVKSRIQSINLEIKGDANIVKSDLEKKLIPVRIIEIEKEKTETFNATEKSVISDQKSRGTIVVYNEFSTLPQPLVATTRFITTEGKLFRIVKNIVVPGMTNIGGELQSGVIEAEVIADKPGEDYNIGPSSFSIPGFKGNPKYDKFYGRSTGNMVGGGSSGDEVTAVSQQDINRAKEKIEKSLVDEIMSELKSEMKNGEIFIEETKEIVVVDSIFSEPGIITDTFDYTSRIRVRIIAFSEQALKKVVENEYNKEPGEDLYKIDIEYGKSNPDYEKEVISIKIDTEAIFNSKIDAEKLKEDLIGKNANELNKIGKKYPQIEGMEVEFWPKFMAKKIPNYDKRVEIEIGYFNQQ